MEFFAEGISAIIAVAFSVSCGLLVEELLFGGLFRLLYVLWPEAARKSKAEQKEKGERTCLR